MCKNFFHNWSLKEILKVVLKYKNSPINPNMQQKLCRPYCMPIWPKSNHLILVEIITQAKFWRITESWLGVVVVTRDILQIKYEEATGKKKCLGWFNTLRPKMSEILNTTFTNVFLWINCWHFDINVTDIWAKGSSWHQIIIGSSLCNGMALNSKKLLPEPTMTKNSDAIQSPNELTLNMRGTELSCLN